MINKNYEAFWFYEKYNYLINQSSNYIGLAKKNYSSSSSFTPAVANISSIEFYLSIKFWDG